MGNWNSGRRPKPTALKVLRGNPGKRPLNVDEPAITPTDPSFDTPPHELNDDPAAAAEWRRVAPMLRRSGIIGEAERMSLLALCQQWARYLDANGKVRQMGMIVKGAKDQPMTNPYIKISDLALHACLRLWVELGLTPSARAKLSALPVVEPEPVSKWQGLL